MKYLLIYIIAQFVCTIGVLLYFKYRIKKEVDQVISVREDIYKYWKLIKGYYDNFLSNKIELDKMTTSISDVKIKVQEEIDLQITSSGRYIEEAIKGKFGNELQSILPEVITNEAQMLKAEQEANIKIDDLNRRYPYTSIIKMPSNEIIRLQSMINSAQNNPKKKNALKYFEDVLSKIILMPCYLNRSKTYNIYIPEEFYNEKTSVENNITYLDSVEFKVVRFDKDNHNWLPYHHKMLFGITTQNNVDEVSNYFKDRFTAYDTAEEFLDEMYDSDYDELEDEEKI